MSVARCVGWTGFLVLAGFAAGCGDDGNPTGSSPPDPPTPDTVEVGGTWRQTVRLPEPLVEPAAAYWNERVWVVGGIDSVGATLDQVLSLDPEAGGWRQEPPLPGRRNHLSLVTLGDSLFALGGATSTVEDAGGTPGYRTFSNVWVLAPGATAWEARPGMPLPRAAGGAAVVDGKIHVVGGFTGSILTAADWSDWRGHLAQDTHVYDPSSGSWSLFSTIPTVRDHLGVVALEGFVYAVGGRRLMIGETVTINEGLDPAGGEWDVSLAAVAGRGGAGVTTLDGCIHVIGGEPRVFGTRHDVYDPVGDRWLRATPLPSPVHAAPATTGDGAIFLIGGTPVEGGEGNPQATVWRFDPEGPTCR